MFGSKKVELLTLKALKYCQFEIISPGRKVEFDAGSTRPATR